MNLPKTSDLEKLPHKFQVAFALFCAKQVFHLVNDKHKEVCLKAIDTVELWLEDKVTSEECEVAANVGYAAANAAYVAANTANAAYTAVYVGYAAYYAARAAAYATYATNYEQQIIEQQWTYYNELLNFDSIVEEKLLEEQ